MKARRTGNVERVLDERTASVLVTRLVTHPKYLKKYRQSHTFLVDVPAGSTIEVGESVVIEETRPLSRSKHWRLVKETNGKQS